MRSSTSSSERLAPLVLALLALAGLGALGSRMPPPDPWVQDPPGRDAEAARLAATGADVLVAGTSRMACVRFGPFAAAYAGEGRACSGMVYSVTAGSVPDILARLEALGVSPSALVLELSLDSVALRNLYRGGRAPLGGVKSAIGDWERAFSAALRGCLFRASDASGPALLTRLLLKALRLEQRDLDATGRGRRAFTAARSRWAFAAEPVPSREVLEASVAAIRRCRARGTRVLLVRLPVSRELLGMEDAWGGGAALSRVAADAGAPLVDLNALPLAEALQDALLDGSHVVGDKAQVLLSEALGALAREAARLDSP